MFSTRVPGPFNRGKKHLTSGAGKTGYPHKKINSRWSKDLKVGTTTIKLLEQHIGAMLPDTGFGNILTMTSKVQAIKKKQTASKDLSEKATLRMGDIFAIMYFTMSSYNSKKTRLKHVQKNSIDYFPKDNI